MLVLGESFFYFFYFKENMFSVKILLYTISHVDAYMETHIHFVQVKGTKDMSS